MFCARAVHGAVRGFRPDRSFGLTEGWGDRLPARLAVLTRRSDYLAANRGLRVARPGFVLLAYPNALEPPTMRYGITVTKRIGNAVVRNRMKRRFRELLWAILPEHGLAGHDHVLIGREGGIEHDFAAMAGELRAALDRARSGKGDPPRRPRADRNHRRSSPSR